MFAPNFNTYPVRYLLYCLFVSGLISPVLAQPVIPIDANTDRVVAGLSCDVLADPTHRLTLADVQGKAAQDRWVRSRQEYPSMGYTFADFWLRVRIRADSTLPTDDRLFAECQSPLTTRMELFVTDSSGHLLEKHEATSASLGEHREWPHPNYVFRFRARPGQIQTLYVHTRTEIGLQHLPLLIWRERPFAEYSQLVSFVWGAFFGLVLMVFVFQVVMYAFVRERAYLLMGVVLLNYIFYEFSRGFGIGTRYLWPTNTWLLSHTVNTFLTTWLIAYFVFFTYTLQLWHKWRLGFWLMIASMIANVLAFCLTSAVPTISRAELASIQALSSAFIYLAIGWRMRRQMGSPMQFYLVGMASVIVFGLALTLGRAGFFSVDGNMNTLLMSMGSVVEIVFVTLGIGAFYRQERQQKFQLETERQELTEQIVREKVYAELARQEADWQGRIEERRNLADDLHDNLGGVLFSLNLKLGRIASQPNIAHQDLAAMQTSLTDAHRQIRLVAHNLMSDELQQRGGLHPALHQFISEVNDYERTQFSLYVDPKATQLAMHTQVGLYYIAFESVQNILRHAEAQQATIHIRFSGQHTVTLTVRDDGVGLSPETLADKRSFATIRRRVNQLSGTLLVTNLPDGGLRTDVSLPVWAAVGSAER